MQVDDGPWVVVQPCEPVRWRNKKPMATFHGRVVLITGANRGFGFAVARAFAKAGATVIVSGRRLSAITEAAARIRQEGAIAHEVELDVADFTSAEHAMATINNRFGGLDIAVNNAALAGPISRIETTDASSWRRSVETNLIGPFNVARAALPLLLARKGVLVNVSSGAAERPVTGMSAYCVTKAGLSMLTRNLALECSGTMLRVFGFRPGPIDADMQTEVRESHLVNEISSMDPDLLTNPEIPASSLLRLCAPDCAVMSGAEVRWNDPRLSSASGEKSHVG